MRLTKPKTWVVPQQRIANSSAPYKLHVSGDSASAWSDEQSCKELPAEKKRNGDLVPKFTAPVQRRLSFAERVKLIAPLLRYMIPLAMVYLAEYLINQGLTELIFFDCSHGFSLSRPSQYRWYQVLYQLGVLISRSSVNIIALPSTVMYLLPVLQAVNTILFFFNAVYFFIPHIAIIFVIIVFEGLLGGASYVNTFDKIHKNVDPSVKEYCLSVASMADSAGIVISGFVSIPLHNYICTLKLYSFARA
ncbi:CRE-CLN-3.3 protein [Aphelenchoides avenae]|nr:CRE-CLN-3.3 protein [Aphelenchus avenae]